MYTALFIKNVADLLKRFPPKHGKVGKMLNAAQLGIDSKLFFDLETIENASITKIDWIH